ncbi:MAG: phosphate signaling complex protein PhoU [Acidimicrobiia bacterium]
MTEHHEIELRHHFDDELDEIRLRLVDMGSLVLANIRRAGTVVLENRLDEVDSVVAADLPINEANDDLEAKVFQILALQQPVATDLRFLVASTRILYEMERSGDLAVNIVKSMNRIDGVPSEPVLEAILGQLIQAAAGMFSRGVEAITTMDAAIGLGADAEDEETDRLTSELFSAVTARQDDLGLEASVALFYIGRFLERIADHGVNIAQNITFAVAGSFPEDY